MVVLWDEEGSMVAIRLCELLYTQRQVRKHEWGYWQPNTSIRRFFQAIVVFQLFCVEDVGTVLVYGDVISHGKHLMSLRYGLVLPGT